MAEPAPPRPRGVASTTVALLVVLCLVVGGVGGFVIAHYGVDSSSSKPVTTPDPETVTCGTFANLTAQQKRIILDKLNAENDTHVSMSLLNVGCPGINAGPDDPVSGAVINLGS